MKKFLLLGAAALTLLAAAPAVAAPQIPGKLNHQQVTSDRGVSKVKQTPRFFYNGKYYKAFRDARWTAPKGEREWRRGQYMTSMHRSRAQVVNSPRTYHLSPAPKGYKWMRMSNDVYLVQTNTGFINQVVLNIFFH